MKKEIIRVKPKCFGTMEYKKHNTICSQCRFYKDCEVEALSKVYYEPKPSKKRNREV